MCNDHVLSTTVSSGGHPGTLTRRRFLQGTAAAAAVPFVFGGTRRLPLTSPLRDESWDGRSAYSMAMHVHSSFSEQDGSMDSQLSEATRTNVDVLWWTDHDDRMAGINYRKTVHFTSLTGEVPAAGEGSGPWTWQRKTSGSVTSAATGGVVASPASPNDPVPGGALQVTSQSASGSAARLGYFANAKGVGWNYHDNLTGQTLDLDVLLTSGWSKGFLEVRIDSSRHQPSAGRPAGNYVLFYRFVPGGKASRVAQGLQGIITVPMSVNSWVTQSLHPSDDIAALWPDLDYRDFAMWALTLSAASTGDLVTGYFDYLRFDRQVSGQVGLQLQADMSARLAPQYPAVTQFLGLEVGWRLPHLNWFGGGLSIPAYGSTTSAGFRDFLRTTVVPQIHQGGGLVSYNHPFGPTALAPQPLSKQNTMLASVAQALLPGPKGAAALGCDLIEVGYPLRQGVDLAHHVGLWDVLSRNAAFLTGNGTNDNHSGANWDTAQNDWFTSTWSTSTSQSDLLTQLAAGRAWCASLGHYRGSLDLLADASAPMGSASVSRVGTRTVRAFATQMPSGGSLQVVRGAVDYVGPAALQPNTAVVAGIAASDLAAGFVDVAVDTTSDCFVRTQVVDASGVVVALSNPVWLLRAAPPSGIPSARAA
jgi:hypothetical protein